MKIIRILEDKSQENKNRIPKTKRRLKFNCMHILTFSKLYLNQKMLCYAKLQCALIYIMHTMHNYSIVLMLLFLFS